jgi:hypothetical protein
LTVDFLSGFIQESFDHSSRSSAKLWPDLEDIFTCVDLSANSGHYLGGGFSPADLRTTRRAILSRIVRMLDHKYKQGQKKKHTPEWRALDDFFNSLNINESGFISMNWDTVIERKIAAIRNPVAVDYGCDALIAEIPDAPDASHYSSEKKHRDALRKPLIVRVAAPTPMKEAQSQTPVIKIHGSINWLYCDNCRRLFWFGPGQTMQIADQLMTEDDLRRIARILRKTEASTHDTIDRLNAKPRVVCFCSSNVPLGTRIATFSYRKALEFPMFQKSWFVAEKLLREASRWVFIGYSLPAADFEFKYLLKRMQLCRSDKPEITVVSGGDKDSVARTHQNYRKFFGRSIRDSNFFSDGLMTYKS